MISQRVLSRLMKEMMIIRCSKVPGVAIPQNCGLSQTKAAFLSCISLSLPIGAWNYYIQSYPAFSRDLSPSVRGSASTIV
jgi:hypothetical protein